MTVPVNNDMDPCPHFLSSYMKLQQRNGISRLSLSVSLALAWNQAHQELNLGQGYSYIHMCLCLSVGLDKDSVLFLLTLDYI